MKLNWWHNVKGCRWTALCIILRCLILIRADHSKPSNSNNIPARLPNIYSQHPTPTPSIHASPPFKHYYTPMQSQTVNLDNRDRTETIALRNNKVTLKPKNFLKVSPSNSNKIMHPVNTVLLETIAQPINIVFRSTSSNVNVMQDHKQTKNFIRYMNSSEEPILMVHNVTKPYYIIQEVREVILPIRNIKQEIYPVSEHVETVIKEMPDLYDHQSERSGPRMKEGANQVSIEEPSIEKMYKLKSFVSYMQGHRDDTYTQVNQYQTGHDNSKQFSTDSFETEHNLSDLGGKSNEMPEPSLPFMLNLQKELDFDIPSKRHRPMPEEEYKADIFEPNISLEPIYRESKTSFQESKLEKGLKRENVHNSSMLARENNKINGNLTALKR